MGVAALIGVVLLGAALAYGMVQYYTRDKRKDAARDAATREAYRPNAPPPGSSS